MSPSSLTFGAESLLLGAYQGSIDSISQFPGKVAVYISTILALVNSSSPLLYSFKLTL